MCVWEAPNIIMLDTQNSLSIALETNMAPSSWNDHFTLERTVVNSIRQENMYLGAFLPKHNILTQLFICREY